MVGTTEILIIGGIVLILFGSAAIPKFFRSIGKAQSEFERGKKEAITEDREEAAQKNDETGEVGRSDGEKGQPGS